MGHSHKKTSMGGSGKGNSGADYSKIAPKKEHVPPSGESNSYEKVRRKIDSSDRSALSKGPYTREKMENK